MIIYFQGGERDFVTLVRTSSSPVPDLINSTTTLNSYPYPDNTVDIAALYSADMTDFGYLGGVDSALYSSDSPSEQDYFVNSMYDISLFYWENITVGRPWIA